jgi:hypothetical protein
MKPRTKVWMLVLALLLIGARVAAQEVVTGNALQWEWHLADTETFQNYSARLIVDAKPDVAMKNLNCVGQKDAAGVALKDGDGLLIYTCQADFPPLANGIHKLQLFIRFTIPASGTTPAQTFASGLGIAEDGQNFVTGRTIFIWAPTHVKPKGGDL